MSGVVFVFCISTHAVAGPRCDAWLKAGRAIATPPIVATKAILKFALYPVIAPVSFVRGTVQAAREGKVTSFPSRWIDREKHYLAAFLSMAVLADGTYVSGLEFIDRTSFAIPVDKTAPIVLVDGFGPEMDLMRLSVPYMEHLGYPGHTQVIRISPRSTKEFLDELIAIRDRHGEISLMDYMGHGTEGASFLEHLKIDAANLPWLTHVFAKDATIRLFNCRTGAGCDAPDYLKAFGDAFLDRGGTVVAPQKYLATGLTDLALVGLQATLHPGSATPGWLVDFSKFVESPYMIAYAKVLGIPAQGTLAEFIVREHERPDILTVKITPRP